ncbi:hypothetical protein [Streptomyces lincolnensis]|uniref:hypothetical protein n=1 Tax=Streptomyces lincolnensis TaxID=1915 RepID=UPI0037D6AA92
MADELSPRRRGPVSDRISVAFAAIALIVSGLSWQESRGANGEAREANNEAQRLVKRDQASRIDFFREWKGTTETLSVVNRSPTHIRDVILTFKDGSYINVNAVGGCLIWWVSPLRVTPANAQTISLDQNARLDFIDAQDPPGHWTITENGLRRQDSKPDKQRDITAAFGDYSHISSTVHCG